MFIFGGDTGVDYQQLQKRRAIADAMMQRSVSGTPKNVGEGLTAIGNAIFGKIADRRLQKKEAAAREDANRLMAALLGGGSASTYGNPYAGGYAPPTPAQKATEAFPTGGTPAPDIMSEPVTARSPQDVMAQYDVAENNADPGLGYGQVGGEKTDQNPAFQQGIVETAKALGVDPVDLATVISYETAGTFDPTKAGPTTQWGTHRGLIQFGEPQAQQYGVDWNDPLGSQLGADGAIAKYMRQAGVQPGMGLLDLYSAVNAGRVGRYNASDANNGGAPGTVADKVAGMADHRAKAAAFLGGQFNPILDNQPNVMRGPAGPGAGQNMPMPRVAGGNIEQIVQLLSNPYASPAQQMIAQTLLGQSMAQQDPLKALQAQKLQAELAQMGQPQPGKLVELYDEQTGQPYKAEFNPQTGQYERVGGVKAPSGMTFESDGQGGFRLTQGGVSNKPLTEGEGKNTGFLIRGRESNAILNDLEAEGTSLGGKIKSGLPLVGNYLQTPEYRRYDQARRDFINAVLRRESGAVISPEEFANAELQYFPQPGDDPDTIAQKRRNREDAVKGFEVGAGAGAKNPLVPQGPSPTPTTGARLRFNPETGELE